MHPGNTAGYGVNKTRKKQNDKAQLISKATATATAAARSVLMSGGTEETALKTAKAAAESVLSPENTVLSGISTNNFRRRRKAKRQAEVFASMALMAAASNARSAQNHVADWESLTASTDNNTRSTYPYARNITTRMTDEPSVLSATSKPAVTSTTRSIISGSERVGARSANKNTIPSTADSWKAKFVNTLDVPPPPPPQPSKPEPKKAPAKSQSPMLSLGLFRSKKNVLTENSLLNEGQKATNVSTEKQEVCIRIHSAKSEVDAEETGSTNSLLQGSFDGDEYDSGGSLSEDEGDENVRRDNKKKPSRDLWKQLDPLLLSFTNNFNCNPLASFVGPEEPSKAIKSRDTKQKKGPKKGKKKQQQQQKCKQKKGVERSNRSELTDDSADQIGNDSGGDSFEDHDMHSLNELENETRDDMDDSFRGDDSCRIGDSYDHSDIVKEASISSSSSEESTDSSQLIRGLNSTSSSEGEIQVRSTIRETMEKIVSNSTKGPDFINDFDSTPWKSYAVNHDSHGSDKHAEFGDTVISRKLGHKPPARRGSKFFRRKSKF